MKKTKSSRDDRKKTVGKREWKKEDGRAFGKAKPMYGKPYEKKDGTVNTKFKDNPRFSDRARRNDTHEQSDYDENINLIEGRNPVLEALKSGRAIDKLFIQKGASEGSIRQIIAIAKDKNILIKEVDKRKLDGLSTTQGHQGVIASAALYKYYDLDEILQIAAKKNEDPFIIVLDEITDNNNLGSILRIADGAGAHGIIIPKRRSATLTPVIAKTSAGAIEYVPVSKVTNLTQTMQYLKKKGLWIVGADMSGDTYYNKDFSGPIALVIGSEGEGMGRLVKENCDYLVSVPMKGNIDSLNAAVSTAVIAYEVTKQRVVKGK